MAREWLVAPLLSQSQFSVRVRTPCLFTSDSITESPTSRASAREKLTRLTRGQFQELSTDVYDELVRRRDAEEGNSAEGTSQSLPLAVHFDPLLLLTPCFDDIHETAPFLPVREDFHPKRNQARQKLATLPKNRFKDLGSDVYFELKRRWPEFAEDAQVRKDSTTRYGFRSDHS